MMPRYHKAMRQFPDYRPDESRSPAFSAKAKLVTGLLAALLVGGGAWGVPAGIKAYKRHRAGANMEESNAAVAGFNAEADAARKTVQDVDFILVAQERDALFAQLDKDARALPDVTALILEAQELFAQGKFDEARALLDPKFSENPSRTPALAALASLREDVKLRVVDFCTNKLALRDRTIRNEFTLLASFAKPQKAGLIERPEKLTGVPDDLCAMIPTESAQLEEGAKRHDLAANLLASRVLAREATLRDALSVAACDRVRATAQGFFDLAKSRYREAKPLNDALPTWYRAAKDDGKLTMAQYQQLLAAQKAPLDLIASGDALLAQLDAYPAKLREQKIVRVARQYDEDVKFSHTKLVPDGVDKHGVPQTKLKYYTTDGRIFYYVLETVTPAGTSSQTIKVGEKDSKGSFVPYSWMSWDYAPDQAEGYVREWKRYGYDDVLSGDAARGAQLTHFLEK